MSSDLLCVSTICAMLKFSVCELESTLFTRQQEKSIIKQSEHLATIAKTKIQSKLKKEAANKLDKDAVLFWKLVSILETCIYL